MQTVELTEAAPAKDTVKSPTGIVLTGTQKGMALMLLLAVLYWRLWRRKRLGRSHDVRGRGGHLCRSFRRAGPSSLVLHAAPRIL